MTEFSIIEKYFAPLTQNQPEAQNLQNDTAILTVPEGQQLVVSTDTLNENIHFFADTSPKIIAQKALRSNLSDLAASGAQPYAYQLALAIPQDKAKDIEALEAWLQAFTQALQADQKEAGIFCSGGDTTTIQGGLSISITIFGLAPKGKAVTRGGANQADHIIVTGPIGAGGLAFKQGHTAPPPMRIHAARVVAQYANAAIDISDGLIADIGHIAKASDLTAVIGYDLVPTVTGIDRMEALTAGDDYEIALCVNPSESETCLANLRALGLKPAIIGYCGAGKPVVKLRDQNKQNIPIPPKGGWQHF